jgi:hypothetical protein
MPEMSEILETNKDDMSLNGEEFLSVITTKLGTFQEMFERLDRIGPNFGHRYEYCYEREARLLEKTHGKINPKKIEHLKKVYSAWDYIRTLCEKIDRHRAIIFNPQKSRWTKHNHKVEMMENGRLINAKVNYLNQFLIRQKSDIILPYILPSRPRYNNKPKQNGFTIRVIDPISLSSASDGVDRTKLIKIHSGCSISMEEFNNFPACVESYVRELEELDHEPLIITKGNPGYSESKVAPAYSIIGNCPCYRANGRCTKKIVFNTDLETKVLNILGQEAFQRYTATMDIVRFRKNLTRPRVSITCPECNNQFINQTAIDDLEKSLVMKHPQDVSCTACSHQFCTDCMKHHPGQICRGMTDEHLFDLGEASDSFQACPHCRVPIQRPSGCNHMSCTNCIKEFCWSCRMNWHDNHQCPILGQGFTINDARRNGSPYDVFYTSNPPPHEPEINDL